MRNPLENRLWCRAAVLTGSIALLLATAGASQAVTVNFNPLTNPVSAVGFDNSTLMLAEDWLIPDASNWGSTSAGSGGVLISGSGDHTVRIWDTWPRWRRSRPSRDRAGNDVTTP